jgi:hypothetical protein
MTRPFFWFEQILYPHPCRWITLSVSLRHIKKEKQQKTRHEEIKVRTSMSVVSWVQDALRYIWKTVLIQIMAESLWEVILDCLHCISSIPVSLQVVISTCFEDESTLAATGDGGESAEPCLSSADAPDASASLDAASFLWIQHSCCSVSDIAKLQRASIAHIGSSLPLTLLSLFPVSNPPRWPSKNSSGGHGSRTRLSVTPAHGPQSPPHSRVPPTRRSATPPKDCPLGSNAANSNGSFLSHNPSPWTGVAVAAKIVRNKVLVLDLDETLIFAATSTATILIPPDFSEVVPTMSGAELYHVWERPYLQLFLDAVSRIFNVVVFTASSPAYADPIIDRIDRARRIRRRLYRSNCTALQWPECPKQQLPVELGATPSSSKQHQPVSLSKDLAILGVPLSHVVLIDNNPCCVAMRRDNGVVVPSYSPPHTTTLSSQRGPPTTTHQVPHGRKRNHHERLSLLLRTVEDTDEVLLGMLPFLEALACAPDVRSVITRSRQLLAS